MQVDIGAHNVLLDQYETAKLSDFAGSSLDESKPTVVPKVQGQTRVFSIALHQLRQNAFTNNVYISLPKNLCKGI